MRGKEIIPENDAEVLTLRQFADRFVSRMKQIIYPTGSDYLRSPQKRAFDIIGSVLFAPILGPVIYGSVVVIKLNDGGPAFFIHERIGKNGEEFGMIKLRSMVTNAEEIRRQMGDEKFCKIPNDPRITKVGKFIRKWSLDELPQFINVLRGDMSLVGVRPNTQDRIDYLGEVSKVEDIYPDWVEVYQLAKPGMASLSTIKGRALLDQSEQGFRDRMRYDMFYVSHASLGWDLKLLYEDIRTMLSRKGAF